MNKYKTKALSNDLLNLEEKKKKQHYTYTWKERMVNIVSQHTVSGDIVLKRSGNFRSSFANQSKLNNKNTVVAMIKENLKLVNALN